MIQNTSTYSKVTTNISKVANKSQEKFSTFSFTLHIPGYHQYNISQTGRSYYIELSRISKGSHCPKCGCYSKSIHSHYMRQLQGLEVFGHPLTLLVRTRKFRCKNKRCCCHIFSESLSGLASSYARNTLEVENRIRQVSLKTSSRIATELLSQQNISCSQSSCLRRVIPPGPQEASGPLPVAIGIDDFAQKKGHIYGSIVMDQITHRPLAIIPGREGDELERYLCHNPQIQYITRDRGRCFIEAINRILPGATQICDRFHLIKNMVDSMTEEIASLSRLATGKQTYQYPSIEECRIKIMESLFSLGEAKHRHKLNLFIAADNCIRKGMSIRETADQLGEYSQVIWRLLRHHTGKDYMSSEQKSILKYADELASEISHGCCELKMLKKTMIDKMSPLSVEHATVGIRKQIGIQKCEVKAYNKELRKKKHMKHLSAKEIQHFILTGICSTQQMENLLKNTAIRQIIVLCKQFREMINGNPKQLSLDKWIKKAMNSDSQAMRKFAMGIKWDQQAVQNAMDIYLNNGLLEGTVNKIKCIKRQMFNRAGYALLYEKLVAFKT